MSSPLPCNQEMIEKSILIVEDDQGTAQILSEYLEENGFNTSLASSGVEAIKMYAQKASEVMLTDFLLPDIDGKAVVEECKKINQNVKVIFLTAYNLHNKVIEDSHIKILEKPCRPHKILQAINEILGHK